MEGLSRAINEGFVIKRRFPRFRVSGVRGQVSFAKDVEVIDMSVGGIACKTDRLLEIGGEHQLTIDGGDFRMKLPAIAVWAKLETIRRVDRHSVLVYTAGFRFVQDLSPETQKLVGFVDPNKREGIRFRVKTRGLVLLDVDEPCEVRLISRSGMLIRSERPLEVESVCLMDILPPKQVPIRMKGRVASQVNGTQGNGTYYEFGVEFIDISEVDRQRLDIFVDSISSG